MGPISRVSSRTYRKKTTAIMDQALLAKIQKQKRDQSRFVPIAQPRAAPSQNFPQHTAFRNHVSNNNIVIGSKRPSFVDTQRNQVKHQIIKHLQKKYKDGETQPLSIAEIGEEEQNIKDCLSNNVIMWLEGNSGLLGSNSVKVIPPGSVVDLLNPGLPMTNINESTPESSENKFTNATNNLKFQFRPKYYISDRKSMIDILKEHHKDQLGGLNRDDLLECMTEEKLEKIIKKLKKEDKLYEIVTQEQKKKLVYFYKDKKLEDVLNLDDSHLVLWRSVDINKTDDKIKSFLKKNNLTVMENKAIPLMKQEVKKR